MFKRCNVQIAHQHGTPRASAREPARGFGDEIKLVTEFRIGGAVGKAAGGDTVFVAEGLYVAPSGNEVVRVDRDVTLSGGWDSTFSAQIATSTVDGEYNGSSGNIGFKTEHQWGEAVTIDRFVIQNCFGVYSAGVFLDGGGGTTVITNTTIWKNHGTGIGVLNYNFLTLTNVTITGLDKLQSRLNDIARRRLPYAVSSALNSQPG